MCESNTSDELCYCFVFNCSRGEQEIKAMLLAASLRRFLRCSYEIVAGIPTGCVVSKEPGRKTIEQLEAMGVRTVQVPNEVDPGFPYANKIGCLSIPTDADKIVFFDNDILCLREFAHDARFASPLNIKMADKATFTTDLAIWQRAYECVGAPLPTHLLRMSASGELSPPYFNSGVVAVRTGIGLSDVWADCCRRIDADQNIPNKRPWLEQAALPVAVAKLGIDVDLLDERHNYPAHLKPMTPENVPYFCHYHSPDVIAREPALARLARELAQAYPLLADRMLHAPGWAAILKTNDEGRRPLVRTRSPSNPSLRSRFACNLAKFKERRACVRVTRSGRAHNVLITGIPRSGTSLFVSMLDQVNNAVCLNEIHYTSQLFELFRSLRSQILRGKPIPNKVDANGKTTTNTIEHDTQVRSVRAQVLNDRFVLAQKITLPYLNWLPRLVDEGWEIWALVRHPAYAISSWKRCPATFPVTRINPPDELFSEVAFSCEETEERRIDIWNHYAQRIHDFRNAIHVVRYEDLTARRDEILQGFCERYGLEMPADLAPLRSRNKLAQYEGLDEIFLDRIHRRCRLDLFDYHAKSQEGGVDP